MTAATTSRPLSPALSRRTHIAWRDLAWLGWRQHRILIGLTTLGVAIVAGLLWWDAADLSHSTSYPLLTMVFLPCTAGVVGVFWGAPVLSGEYEQRTHLLVWSQDVSPLRWLTAKIVLLAACAAILWGIIGAADSTFIHAITTNGHQVPFQYGPLGSVGFESWIPLQMIYAVFGFALGLAVSALVRRTVAAMGITLVLFTAARFAVGLVRPNFVAPLRYAAPPTWGLVSPPGLGSMPVGDSWSIDAAGHTVDFPAACVNYNNGDVSIPCAKAHGLVATYVDYQPGSRVLPFHLIEFGIFAILAAALLAFALYRIRSNRVIG
ncbi:MAG TPA: ABC transporter permease subunit [Pseudonocardiaceae bacterium]|nr:ABC transporter permease subunit [Pseudonocardiaceae bacterium]